MIQIIISILVDVEALTTLKQYYLINEKWRYLMNKMHYDQEKLILKLLMAKILQELINMEFYRKNAVILYSTIQIIFRH
jgi:hypothetical protein